MRTAFIFPGQASQYVGMGKDLYETEGMAKALFDRADDILPFDLKRICFEGPVEELTQTRVTQPAIFVHSVIISLLLSPRGIDIHAAAGHSLGEYSALVATGALQFDDALAVVALRGELMQNAGDERPGTMAAIIGLAIEKVEEVCASASTKNEVVVAANMNAPGQVAISGDVVAVHRAMELAKEAGAKRALQLNVSGAFHSPLMAPAAEKLAEQLEKTPFRPPSVAIYQNVTARPTTDSDVIKKRLIEQLTHPVRWVETIEAIIGDGVERFIEVGPGAVLQGLNKRIAKGLPVIGVGTVDELNAYRNA
ncbi:ACP S-malonyltransferase [bacterium]|nr:ACP S-malonyltransferase [bacterium]